MIEWVLLLGRRIKKPFGKKSGDERWGLFVGD